MLLKEAPSPELVLSLRSSFMSLSFLASVSPQSFCCPFRHQPLYFQGFPSSPFGHRTQDSCVQILGLLFGNRPRLPSCHSFVPSSPSLSHPSEVCPQAAGVAFSLAWSLQCRGVCLPLSPVLPQHLAARRDGEAQLPCLERMCSS